MGDWMKKEHKEQMKARARNIGLLIAYDGGNYHGFQRQLPPVVAVQNILEEKLAMIFGDSIELAAAGRTDAGVHAYGQVVNFFTDGRIPVERIVQASNSLLPDDIVVREAWEASHDFSARHSAHSKVYIYRIWQDALPDPFQRQYSWHIRQVLDMGRLQESMQCLIGTHDFSSFRAAGGAPMRPVRTMYDANCSQQGHVLEFRFFANGFLYHMVRNLVGTLVQAGLGRISPAGFEKIMQAHDRQRAAATAPAQGLYLYKVNY